MESSQSNIDRNKAHYEQLYSETRVDAVVQKVRNWRTFLDDAVQTDTSWHGMYHGDFEARLKGAKVLELGSGDGLNALIMAALGAEVTAIDISSASAAILTEAAARLQIENIFPMFGDLSEIDFEPNTFDFVVGKAFLHHLTHEVESRYLQRVAVWLKPDGEARFFEPAINSQLLDTLRWIVPVPNRPSILARKAFAEWEASDPHPERDNSSAHYIQAGKQYFEQAEIEYIGSIERLNRLLPRGNFNRRYRRWAHRMEVRLPRSFRHSAARSQLIVYIKPTL